MLSVGRNTARCRERLIIHFSSALVTTCGGDAWQLVQCCQCTVYLVSVTDFYGEDHVRKGLAALRVDADHIKSLSAEDIREIPQKIRALLSTNTDVHRIHRLAGARSEERRVGTE